MIARGARGPQPAGLALAAAILLCGCAAPSLDSARREFYSGRFRQADTTLSAISTPGVDRVLVLMERGTARQAAGDYARSSADFIEASDVLDKLETYSVSKGAASWVVNDGVQDFRGVPFERTLLHAFTALNHLAETNWENAAVEARRIIRSLDPERRGEYPEDAFSRYVAGFCLEMIDDRSNASLQYRKASSLAGGTFVDEDTGRLLPAAPARKTKRETWENELVCFVLSGRSARGNQLWSDDWQPPTEYRYAEIRAGGKLLGRSYSLADTVELAHTTDQMEAARKVAKTIGRVILKEVIAEGVAQGTDNDALGELTRFILIGLFERPDVRRWETLPRWLQVARVPCPADLESFDVEFKTAGGTTVRRVTVNAPLSRKGGTRVSFCRDLAPSEPPPAASASETSSPR